MEKFGGKAALAEVAGVHITRVHRWLLPKDKGGTGGQIPQKHITALLEKARERNIELSLTDFFSTGEPVR